MGEDAQDQFPGLRVVMVGSEGGAVPPFILAETALGWPALVIERAVEALAHGTATRRLRLATPDVAVIEADYRLPQAEFVFAQAAVVLDVVTRVCQDRINRNQASCLTHVRGEIGRVLPPADARHCAEDEARRRVDDSRQLRPSLLAVAFLDLSHFKGGGDVVRLEPRHVYRGDRLAVD